MTAVDLRTDGPHSPEYTRELGNALAEAVRCLNYATRDGAPGLESPADARVALEAAAPAFRAQGAAAEREATALLADEHGVRWLPVPQRRRLGYVVAVRNQASGQFEDVNSTVLHPDEADACWKRDLMTSEAADSDRRERYVVCEVIPVEDDDA